MDVLDEAASVVRRASGYDKHESIQALIGTGLHAWPELEQGYSSCMEAYRAGMLDYASCMEAYRAGMLDYASCMEAYRAGMYGPVAERQEWLDRAARIWDVWKERARALELI